MNEKKKTILVLSGVLLATIIINVVFFYFFIDSGLMWASILAYVFLIWDIVIFVLWLASFLIKYKVFTIENNVIEVYAGFANRYIKVNGELKDEYKSILTFTPINLSCMVENHKINVVISITNNITIKCDDNLIK